MQRKVNSYPKCAIVISQVYVIIAIMIRCQFDNKSLLDVCNISTIPTNSE